ncbi:hypothetical protein BKE38_01800 [Pseudoroseomonas deserti]|uniref:Uncharacterized protein n=1 Tax=Teichococcus deserti TaxID=1817963 RepID=A0A1V2H7R7_9PROT|nr:hypothetical protein BKE38_01800 [Pseudoroseomonas deserti]
MASAIVGAGGRDVQRQQMPQRVDRHVQLRALLPLGPVIPGAGAAFWRGAQRSAVEDGCAGLRFPLRGDTQDAAEVLGQGLEAPAASQRCACCYTVAQGGRSFGIQRHGAPVLMT